ncbi:MAG: phage holin family protein [Oscillospiraceae bacterium]|nr:phage holin family protein [Oscillospiraceae bacterium]
MENVNRFKAVIAAVIAALTALWGWFGWLVVAWLACMTIDYFTGYGAAMKNGEWSSVIAREGIWHKVGCVVTVIAACILDAVVGYLINIPGITLPWTYTVLFAPLVVAWYILMEMGSILENVGKMGAPLPGFLKKAIAVLAKTADTAGEHAVDGSEK